MTSHRVFSFQASPARFGLGVALLTLLADQLGKQAMFVIYGINTNNTDQSYLLAGDITPFFNLVMVWNKGLVWGLMRQDGGAGQLALAGFGFAILIILLLWLVRAKTRALSLGLGLVMGGALGNIFDRLRHGAVADFFDFYAGNWHWPAFNIADIAINIGVAILIWDTLSSKPGNT